MAKLNKHASVVDQIQNLVRKQASGKESVVGTPGADTKPESIPTATNTINKNEVKPENNTNEFKQEPSKEEAGKVVSDNSVKSAGDLKKLSEEIHSLITKYSEGQETVVGTPGADTKQESVPADTNTVAKNEVKPEKNENEFKQEPSKEEAGKVVSDAKIAAVVNEKLAQKIAAYNLGAELIVDLLKSSGYIEKSASEKAFLKEAGRRDFDELITQMASEIKVASPTVTSEPVINEKVAEEAGAAYFDNLYKSASDNVLLEKVATLEQEISKITTEKTAEEKAKEAQLAKVAAEKADAEHAEKIASLVLTQLESKLKTKEVEITK
jgi:hypothetical protein